MSSDLRTFIKKCKGLFWTEVVNPNHEFAAWIRGSCDHKGPIIASEVPGYIPHALIGGVYANPRRVKRILVPNYGIPGKMTDLEAVVKYSEVANISPKDALVDYTQIVENAACQENVIPYRDVNIRHFPICTHNEFDAGKFITAGVNVVKWIDGKTHGLGIHRMMVVDHNTLTCLAPPNRRIGFPHYKASEESNEGVKMAVIIGAAPSVVLASQAKVTQTCEKYIVAAKLQNERIPIVKCITSDLLVPADSEIILECTTIPNSCHSDVPFAEYPGTYSYRSNAFEVRIDCITHRNNSYYQTILTGKTPQEDSNLCAFPYAAEVYRAASQVVEKVTDISAFIGNNVFDTLICVKKNSDTEIENLMHLLLSNKYLKSVAVMDDDMKADEESFRFCYNTRYQPNRDTIITNLSLGASLDPSSPLFQSTSKIAMNLTIPTGSSPEEKKLNKLRHTVATTDPKYKIGKEDLDYLI